MAFTTSTGQNLFLLTISHRTLAMPGSPHAFQTRHENLARRQMGTLISGINFLQKHISSGNH